MDTTTIVIGLASVITVVGPAVAAFSVRLSSKKRVGRAEEITRTQHELREILDSLQGREDNDSVSRRNVINRALEALEEEIEANKKDPTFSFGWLSALSLAGVAEEPRRTALRESYSLLKRRTSLPGPGPSVLAVFVVLVFAFGIVSLVHYWDLIKANIESLFYALWLFVFMVLGMFVQVLATNYRSDKPLFAISASQLLFPLLFSIVVYYPIWAIAATAPRNLFPVYAAFLNGYFWENVVSAARLPVARAEAAKAPTG